MTAYWAKDRYSTRTSSPRFSSFRNSLTHLCSKTETGKTETDRWVMRHCWDSGLTCIETVDETDTRCGWFAVRSPALWESGSTPELVYGTSIERQFTERQLDSGLGQLNDWAVDQTLGQLDSYLSCDLWVQEPSEFLDVCMWRILHLKPLLHHQKTPLMDSCKCSQQ